MARPIASGRTRVLVHGFTLVEMLVVMAVIALLLSLAAPRYFDAVDRSREAALRTNLRVMRESIDRYQADTGRLPASLKALAQLRYIRDVPLDPITERADTWIEVSHPDRTQAGVFDVRSGAAGTARDGSAFSTW